MGLLDGLLAAGAGHIAAQAKSAYKQGEKSRKDLKKRVAALSIGTISRVIPGSYIMTAAVQGEAIPEVQCVYVPGMMSLLFGAKDCSMPTEGTPVLMITMPKDPKKRIALCSLPDELKGFKDLQEVDWVSMFGSSPEPGENYWSVKSYLEESNDTKKRNHIPTNSDRPPSMLPGEWAQGNPMGVFIALFHFMATLKATERAKLECFVFDDLVRLTSGQFQHWNAFGETHIFNDAGFNNIEINGSHTSQEVRGYNKLEEAVNTTESQNANEERAKQKDPKIVMKRRFRMFMGGLGDMCQIYLRNMQDGSNPDTYDAEETWGASFKLNLNNAGALDVVSAAGIGASLNDRIPIPKRTREAWDPEGDRPEDKENDEMFKKKEHFDYDDQSPSKYPYMRNIKAMDGEVWENALSYQRFDELKKDFKTPEAQATNPPNKIYDTLESDSRQDDYVGRKAGWRIEKDGSVRIWDNWGGEIYMRGGDIVLACPGHIIMQPGKGIIGLGNDIVFKAKKSIDITATDKDVRITAGQNIAAYAEKGGMLFEANGEREPTYSADAKGEDVPGGGIVFKAKNSSIYFWSKRFTIYADYFFTKIQEAIVLSAKTLEGVFKNNFIMETDGSAGVMASSGSAYLFGGSVAMAGGRSAGVFKGGEAMVPLTWTGVNSNPYESLLPSVQNAHAQFSEEGTWLGVLEESQRANLKFTYRTPQQYGTASGTEVFNPATEFTAYQTRWQLQKNMGYGFIQGTTEVWKEEAVNSTYPWPGEGVRDRAYAKVDTLSNVTGAIMAPLDRKDLVKKFTPQIQRSSMDEYIIMK